MSESASNAGNVGEGAEQGGSNDEIDAAQVALNRARRFSTSQPDGTSYRAKPKKVRSARSAETTYSSAGQSARDPMGLEVVLKRVVAERGWQSPMAVGSVMADWPALVGPDIAAHAVPESFEASTLQVRCESTAWATQLRLLAPALLAKFRAELGEGVVTRIDVLGPVSPNWKKGRRHIKGRGPRDTYG